MLKPAIYKASYTVLFFLANLIMANMLLPSNFGSISLMLVNASIIYLVTGVGTDSIILYSLTNRRWDLNQAVLFTRYAIVFQLLFFSLLQLVNFLATDHTLLSQGSAAYLLYEFLYFAGLILTEKYLVLLYCQHKAAVANRVLVVLALMYIGMLFYIKSLTEASFFLLFSVFCLYFFVQGMMLLLAFHLKHALHSSAQISRESLVQVFKLSLVVALTNFIQLLAYRVDFILLKHFHTSYEVGLYAQANKFANLMWVIPNIFAFLLMPKFSGLRKEEVPIVYRYAFVSGIILLLVTAAVTQLFYTYLVTAEYKPGLSSFYLMLPGYFCWSVVIYFGAYFAWQGKFINNLLLSSFCFITIVVSDLLLIPSFSIAGAAIANTIAYSVTLLLCIFLYAKETSLSFLKIVQPMRSDRHVILNLLK